MRCPGCFFTMANSLGNLTGELPQLDSVEDLSEQLHIDIRLLYLISNDTARFYRVYRIPKSNGYFRTIEAPSELLKRIQRWILKYILQQFEAHRYSTAYECGKNIRSNAWRHVGQPVVLKLDVKNYFPSLHSHLAYGFFKMLGYPEAVTVMLVKFCCLHGHLPQGAPSSPHLSNLLMLPVDDRLADWLRSQPIRYSRYADDMTFSGDLTLEQIQSIVTLCRSVLRERGLKLNLRKIRIQRQGARQTVTGLVVNRQLHILREKRRKLRQMMYYVKKFGWRNCLAKTNYTLEQLRGMANFAVDMEPDNSRFQEWRIFLYNCADREER